MAVYAHPPSFLLYLVVGGNKGVTRSPPSPFFLPSYRHLAYRVALSCGDDAYVRLWTVETGAQVRFGQGRNEGMLA